jgi:tRNA pseudouridine13 synthase
VPWGREPKLSAATIKDVEIVEIARDHEPLHPGALAGNRFAITIRGVGPEQDALSRAEAIVGVLAERGVPNFFGPQRFGVRGEGPDLARHLLAREPLKALDLFLGAPSTREGDPRAQAFRRAYEKKSYGEALSLVPGRLNGERRLLEQLVRGRRKEAVAGELSPATRRMALSAWQALLFNRVLAARLPTLDVPRAGDLLAAEGAARGDDAPSERTCTDPAADAAAVRARTLHLTGPLFGERVALAEGEPGVIERAVLAAEALPSRALVRPAGLSLWGERRPLRFLARNLAVRALAGECSLVFEFTLPPGCFATALLAEVMKDEAPVN